MKTKYVCRGLISLSYQLDNVVIKFTCKSLQVGGGGGGRKKSRFVISGFKKKYAKKIVQIALIYGNEIKPKMKINRKHKYRKKSHSLK